MIGCVGERFGNTVSQKPLASYILHDSFAGVLADWAILSIMNKI